jgi:hypothetical protein
MVEPTPRRRTLLSRQYMQLEEAEQFDRGGRVEPDLQELDISSDDELPHEVVVNIHCLNHLSLMSQPSRVDEEAADLPAPAMASVAPLQAEMVTPRTSLSHPSCKMAHGDPEVPQNGALLPGVPMALQGPMLQAAIAFVAAGGAGFLGMAQPAAQARATRGSFLSTSLCTLSRILGRPRGGGVRGSRRVGGRGRTPRAARPTPAADRLFATAPPLLSPGGQRALQQHMPRSVQLQQPLAPARPAAYTAPASAALPATRPAVPLVPPDANPAPAPAAPSTPPLPPTAPILPPLAAVPPVPIPPPDIGPPAPPPAPHIGEVVVAQQETKRRPGAPKKTLEYYVEKYAEQHLVVSTKWC